MTLKKGIQHATKVMSATKAVRQTRRRVRPVSQRGQRGQSCSCSSTRHKKGMLEAGRAGNGRRDRELDAVSKFELKAGAAKQWIDYSGCKLKNQLNNAYL